MTTVTLSEAKAKLAALLGEVSELGEHVLITRSGKPTAVLLSVDDYEGLLETLEILADADLAQAVRQGLKELVETVWDRLRAEGPTPEPSP